MTCGKCGKKKKARKTNTHAHKYTQISHFLCFCLLQRGHLQLCQPLQVGQRSEFDNWREFREQTFDKHDNALTALIGPWLMTDIPVACLLQNVNVALGENYSNVVL